MKPKYLINFISKINTTKNKIIMKTMLLCIFLSVSFAFVSEKSGWIEVDWKIIFIPALLVLQIIIISTALKNRYKKH
ncbi:hypothetical protein SAMN05444397_103517 [Flavobacterium aquidurense]|uniref:Transmembrane Fragile-X-F protein n=2 Tax=Flavobacterium frigidimaris TaxID=262320 RepID=A0ABX4BMF8_FLAFR|nr:hypothetical protein B0A65_17050 [Flavobacterium frigidimaris]SDZ12312.1 hypothetical protein SAMN05444397_103517 [Flavobacterium aquidurense]